MTHTVPEPLQVVREDRSVSWIVIFAAGFVVLLVLAVASAPFGLKWRSWLPGAEGGGSFIGSVRSAVYSFMSYLT